MMPSTNSFSRRHFVERLAHSLLGVPVLPTAFSQSDLPEKGKAKRVIYLFMTGGMSHLDTFDLKSDQREVQGPISPIKTSVTGLNITSKLPLLAKQMHRFAQVRSMHHTQGNHEPGQYYMRTGYKVGTGVVKHPSIGTWITHQADRLNPALPPYVRLGGLGSHPANGFLPVSSGPLPISSPDAGLQNSQMRDGLSQPHFEKNVRLAEALDSTFRKKRAGSSEVRAYSELYADAIRLMTSKDIEAFDLKKEPAAIRKAYGDTPFGAGCLLARRLVENDVRFVEVDLGGWDTHTDNHKGVAERCALLDGPLSTLLSDLDGRGLLDETLVVLATEFGRSPEIDQFAGRTHHPLGYTCMMAGAGVNGGAIIGATDKIGKEPVGETYSAQDFNATIAQALGLDTRQMASPFKGGQRFSIGGKDTGTPATPIAGIFG